MIATFFKALHVLDIEELDKEQHEKLLLCGSKNWDYYFVDDNEKANVETLHDVRLLEFQNSKEFNRYMHNREVIDFSLEHKNPMVLTYE